MYAEVITDITNKNVDRIFCYAVPAELESRIERGMRVYIPFGKGNRKITGYVIGFTQKIDFDESKVKSIVSIADNYPVFSEVMLELAAFMKKKYYAALSECLQCIMPKIVKDKTQRYVSLNDGSAAIDDILSKNNAQSRVIELLMKNGSMSITEIIKTLGISSSPVLTLEKNAVVSIGEKRIKRDVVFQTKKTLPFNPSDEQKEVIDFALGLIDSREKKPLLIRGVTGSGKTEVYMQIIEEVISRGKQAIVLVPEISLTPQTVNRFVSRFGAAVSVTHSKLSDGERFDQWQKAREGEISIIVGPRSALFTPFSRLGCIIIDEEHEHTYKSEISPKYDAKEVAVYLGKLTGCLVVFASATPSIESYYKAKKGEYYLKEIKNRINGMPPKVELIDMRAELEVGNKTIFGKKLFEAIKNNLENNKQTILFLNRRGHSTFVSCRKCGYVMRCENCSVNYTYHISTNRLMCHYCNAVAENPKICPQCGSPYIKYFGIGTQKIELETQKLFPKARTLRMDADTVTKKNSHEMILRQFAEQNADILIGTQMIAKGLDFPNVTLVGVIAADTSLNSGDFRSAENTFQLLTQVSGRAGRANNEGTVYIQTYQPEHYAVRLAKDADYTGFYDYEIELRRQSVYPPFSHIFQILFSGENEKEIILLLNRLAEIMFANQHNEFDILGPAPAVMYKINGRYRHKILVKGIYEDEVRDFTLKCIEILKKEESLDSVTVNITLDPQFMA